MYEIGHNAIKKSTVQRFKILDDLFRSIGLTMDELVEKVTDLTGKSISSRQIEKDIRYFKDEYDMEFETDRKSNNKKIYKYTDASQSIYDRNKLTSAELNTIKDILVTLSLFEGMPQFEWIKEILPRLEENIKSSDNFKNSNPIIGFSKHSIDNKGIEYIKPIYEAILNKKVLLINYQPFGENEIKITFHPYFLKEYNNRWFVYGLNDAMQKYDWNLALDRIKDQKIYSSNYIDCEIDINWNEYFDDFIGVTKLDTKCEKVMLHFFNKAINYIRSKPLHPSMKIKKESDENCLKIELEIIMNYELESLILSFGENVEVIAPIALRDSIKSKLTKALKKYK